MLRTLFLALFATTALSAAEPVTVLKGGTIYDGTTAAGKVGDVIIQGDKILAAGQVKVPEGAKIIDCTELVVCPGFIDLHTHCDGGTVSLTSKAGKVNKNYITQGVTTVVTGNCGSGPVDTAKFFTTLETNGVATNVIHQVPHNSVREAIMGNANRLPSAEELKKMEAKVEQGMKDGCYGMATGLIYNPGTYSKTEELIALSKVVAKYKGHYASHIRNEGSGLLTAIEEAITIGKDAGVAVHVSHIKASGSSAHGLSSRAVGVIEAARAKGLTVTADQYPYIASSTSLKATLVPSSYREGSNADYVARYSDPVTGPKIKADLEKSLKERNGGRAIQVARYTPKPSWQGKRISAIAEAEKKSPLEIVVEIETHGGASVVNFAMNEEDVRVYMTRPWVATASDGGVHMPGDTVPHPRSYGTFPRKVGKYCLEDNVLPLEAAIRSATGLPADILRLKDRGYLKANAFADVLVFDPKTYRETSTYEKPHQYATGVRYLFVNGNAVIEKGEHKPEVLAGKPLRWKGE